MTHSGGRKRTVWLWVAAVVLTLAAVAYQRLIGPTRPVRGAAQVAAQKIPYTLKRSHGGDSDFKVSMAVPDRSVSGFIIYRRFGTSDPWSRRPLEREGTLLAGELPHQPPGGKLLYRLYLLPAARSDSTAPMRAETGTGTDEAWVVRVPSGAVAVPSVGPTIVRFRGGVPAPIMIPHVIFMFLGMLWSNRAGIEALSAGGDPRRRGLLAFLLLVVGGLLFGPIVQWYAFGEAWTGFPVGTDLTDNKTLIAVLAWAAAMLASRRAARRYARGGAADGLGGVRWWYLGAALVTLIIFSVPHSVLGTELDYSTLPAN